MGFSVMLLGAEKLVTLRYQRFHVWLILLLLLLFFFFVGGGGIIPINHWWKD